ncbi:MAG: hypothetical protein IJ911_07925 [Salinivirgaceae bacterium]|nr:hypothetical protein [Salinivirgaceae bacterium]
MKKIIDFLVAAYTLFTPQRYKEKRIEFGLWFLNITLAINGFSLLCCFLPIIGKYVKIENIYIYGTFIFCSFVVIAFSIKKALESFYLSKYEYIKSTFENIPKTIMICVVVVHYFTTIFLVFYCMKFLLCLRP